MTLKEKLEVEIMHLPIMDEVIEDIATNLEYVAEDFAIGFGEFMLTKVFVKKSVKELLEIYKKEKGL